MEYLLKDRLPTPVAATGREDDLSYLLEDERLHGTRERDKTAPRADWYYFPKGAHYLLVDDATGESRPIMVKEFAKARPDEASPWPVMHDTFMKLSETAQANSLSGKALREKAWKTWVTREQDRDSNKQRGMALFDEHSSSSGSLTRTASLNSLKGRPMARRLERGNAEESLMPYQAASGNSVVLTSNIASTSNARSTSGNLTPNGVGYNGMALGQGRRIMQMSKRVQLLKGQAAAKLSAANSGKAVDSWNEPLYLARAASDDGGDGIEIIGGPELGDDVSSGDVGLASSTIRRQESSSSTESMDVGVDLADVESEAMFDEDHHAMESQVDEGRDPYQPSMDEQARQRVLTILKAAKAPAKLTGYQRKELKRARSMGFRIERINPTAPAKPGYCENCRVKYADFEQHVVGRRHRKFATNEENFKYMDEFLHRVRRAPKMI